METVLEVTISFSIGIWLHGSVDADIKGVFLFTGAVYYNRTGIDSTTPVVLEGSLHSSGDGSTVFIYHVRL